VRTNETICSAAAYLDCVRIQAKNSENAMNFRSKSVFDFERTVREQCPLSMRLVKNEQRKNIFTKSKHLLLPMQLELRLRVSQGRFKPKGECKCHVV
jgi:hypothetical protein